MDTLTNAIIVKFQKMMNAETDLTDAKIIRFVTPIIASKSNGEKKLILMTYTLAQFKAIK